jgi:hypothetical protein
MLPSISTVSATSDQAVVVKALAWAFSDGTNLTSKITQTIDHSFYTDGNFTPDLALTVSSSHLVSAIFCVFPFDAS